MRCCLNMTSGRSALMTVQACTVASVRTPRRRVRWLGSRDAHRKALYTCHRAQSSLSSHNAQDESLPPVPPASSSTPASPRREPPQLSMSSSPLQTEPALESPTTPPVRERWCMETALFGWSDMHTSPVTHLAPSQRLRTAMPLLPWRVRCHIETELDWFLQVEQWERQEDGKTLCGTTRSLSVTQAQHAPARSEVPQETAPCALPRETPADREEPEVPNDKHELEDVVPPCPIDAGAASLPTLQVSAGQSPAQPPPSPSEPTTPSTCPACPQPPSWYIPVVGRPKVLRYALRQFLHQPVHWFDAGNEILERAFRLGVSASETAEVRPGWLRFNDPLLAEPDNIALWSEDVVAALFEFVGMSAKSFHGPRALWLSHVIHHRHDVPLLTSAQCPPFSFGEVKPSVVPSDFEPLAYAEDASSTSPLLHGTPTDDVQHSSSAVSSSHTHESGDAGVLSVDHPWEALSEREQNEILFGPVAADVAAWAARAGPTSLGVYEIYHHERPRAPMTPATQQQTSDPIFTNASGAETALATDSTQATKDTTEPQQRDKAAARRAVQRYQVDERYLRLIEPDLDPKGVEAATANVIRAQRTSGTRAPLTNPVQLERLWRSFQAAPSATLLDVYVATQASLYRLQREVTTELAGQTALLLLFFARDEVRLVTSPVQTSAHLWRLHQRLRAVVRQLAVLDGLTPHEPPLPGGRAPSLASLDLRDRLSFACFGCAHVPHAASALHDVALCVDDASTHSSLVSCRDAASLYAALCALYPDRPADQVNCGERKCAVGKRLKPTGPVPDLTATQSFALEMCFPRTAAEARTYRSVLSEYWSSVSSTSSCDPQTGLPATTPENTAGAEMTHADADDRSEGHQTETDGAEASAMKGAGGRSDAPATGTETSKTSYPSPEAPLTRSRRATKKRRGRPRKEPPPTPAPGKAHTGKRRGPPPKAKGSKVVLVNASAPKRAVKTKRPRGRPRRSALRHAP